MNFDLNVLAQIVGNNLGINVVQGTGFAIGKNDNGGLFLYVPPMNIGNEDDAMLLRGGLCHEAVGHARHTDFNAKRGPTPLHLAIENVLEDARIEKAAWKLYPKARKMLDESMAAMIRRNGIKRASTQSTPPEKASIALLLRLMVEELGYCKKLIDWKVDWAEAVQCFGDETMNKAWALSVSGYQVSSTQEVIKVAAKIVKLLQKGFEDQQISEEKQKQGQDQGGNDSQGQDQGGNAQGSGCGSGRAPTPLNTGAINPSEFDRGDLLKGQLPVDPRNTMQIHCRKAKSFGAFIPTGSGKIAAQRLKSTLAQRLLAVVEDEEDSLVEYGALASDRLVDARMGDRYVFSEPGKPGERLDTAFSLLIDMSGSMAKVSDQACLAATWAIGDTLNGYCGMGLSFTVSSFNNYLFEMKDWNQPWKRGECLSSYGAIGSTYTYAAVKNRLEHLVKRRESRKVLYLITDGDIGDLSSLVNSADEMGCEIVVMMIGSEAKKPNAPYLKRFSVVSPDKIASEMLKTVISLF
jgi:hypothetical protein